jgi:hypothetical protein
MGRSGAGQLLHADGERQRADMAGREGARMGSLQPQQVDSIFRVCHQHPGVGVHKGEGGESLAHRRN